MEKPRQKPETKATIAILSGAIAILTDNGQIVLTPDAALLVAKEIPNAAILAKGITDPILTGEHRGRIL